MTEVSEFNRLVFTLVNTFEKKSRNDVDLANLDRLKRRLTLARSTLEEIMCVKSLPVFMKYKDQILSRDEKFFLSLDVRGECNALQIDANKEDEFIFSLIDAMKNYYVRARPDEKKFLWDAVNTLFELSVKYKVRTKN
jgi:hypothetical protein